MRTILVSDFHLGSSFGGDLLRRARFREILLGELAGADQVVLLGDVIEFRERPLADALEIARPFFDELADAVGDARVVLVPGNHDYQLVAPWLEERRLEASPLGLEQVSAPSSGPT